MRRRSGTAIPALILASSIGLLTSGCTPSSTACAGVGVPTSAIYLDTSLWLAAHPRGDLNACYSDQCVTVTTDSVQPVVLSDTRPATGSPPDTLTITSSTRLHVVKKLTLASIERSDGCRPVAEWGRNVRLNPDGELVVGGWNGLVPSPATHVHSTHASP